MSTTTTTSTNTPRTTTNRAHPRLTAAVDGEKIFAPPGWDWTQCGEVGWWLRPGWGPILLGPEGLRLEAWRQEGWLTTVKKGPHRVVYRVDLPGGAIYIKHFLVPDRRAKYRQWFRRGKGRNEAKRARKLADLGVPTITPVALGEQRKRKFLFENYLVSPAIDDATPLDAFVEGRLNAYPEPERTRLRQALAVGLAELTARLHEAGFVHLDFHPGNVLVQVDPAGRPHLAMIDLDALRVVKRLGWKEALVNLAHLNHYFWLRSDRSDRLRFLRAYLAARPSRPPDPAALARGIEAETRTWAERLWRRWGKRCRKANKYFATYERSPIRAIASRDLDPEAVATLLADPDAPFRAPGARILKDSRTTTVVELVLSVSGRPTPVIYKRFPRKKWPDPIFSLFRPSRAWRAWQGGQHLLCRGVPTPQNLAYLARIGPIGLPRETYLATLKAEPSITLGDYAREILPGLEPRARRERIVALARALAWLLRTLHDRSLSHRDLKAANILIEGDPDAPEPRLSLIDLVGVELRYPLPTGRRVQNLARLHLSLAEVVGRTRTDTLRFLRAYWPGALVRPGGWKALWRAVAARTRQKVERNQRNGRPLS